MGNMPAADFTLYRRFVRSPKFINQAQALGEVNSLKKDFFQKVLKNSDVVTMPIYNLPAIQDHLDGEVPHSDAGKDSV